MKYTKRMIAILLTAVLALSLLLTACGSDSGNVTDTDSSASDASTPLGDVDTAATQTGETSNEQPANTEPGSPADEMLENKAVTEFIEWIKNATIRYDYIEFSDAPEGRRGNHRQHGDERR